MGDALTLRERLADVARFVRQPRFVAEPMAWGREAQRTFLVVFVLSIVIGPAIAGLTMLIDTQAGFLPTPDIEPRSAQRRIIDFLIIAPIFEELLFRSWLTGRRAALRFAAYGAAATVLTLVEIVFVPGGSAGLGWIAVGIVFAGLFHWGRTHHRDTAVPAWFISQFRWIVWGSALLFGLLHLGNFTAFGNPLGVLAVLPQMVGGLLLAYTRTRLGLGAAMAHHAAFNAVWVLYDNMLG